jgi:alkylation response protein AidB-like acyl-CoA dehydrogenase
MMDGVAFKADHASEHAEWRALGAEFAETAAALDRAAAFPHDNLARLHEEGLLGLTVGRADGGEEAGLDRAAKLVGAVAEGCASTALVLAMQLIHQRAIAANPAWPALLRSRVGRSAAGCGALVNALRVESVLGSPNRGGLPETVARRTRAGWSVSGHKLYSTGAPGLTWMLVWARTDDPAPRTGYVLVPARSEGVEVVETWDHLGLRASGSHDVLFHEVHVPEDHAVDLREPSERPRGEPLQAVWNAVLIGSLYTGVATAARDWLVRFFQERAPSGLGAPLATLPRLQEALGGIEARRLTNRRLIEDAAAAADRGELRAAAELSLLKASMAETAIEAVQDCVRLAGNPGLSRANPLERHLRDVLCARVHAPQADAAHIAAGRILLGLQGDTR